MISSLLSGKLYQESPQDLWHEAPMVKSESYVHVKKETDVQAQPSTYAINPILPCARSTSDPVYDEQTDMKDFLMEEKVSETDIQPSSSLKQQFASEYSFRPTAVNNKRKPRQGKSLRWNPDQVPSFKPIEKKPDPFADYYGPTNDSSPPEEHEDREMRRHKTKEFSRSSDDVGRGERDALRAAKIQKEKLMSDRDAERSVEADNVYVRMRDMYTKSKKPECEL